MVVRSRVRFLGILAALSSASRKQTTADDDQDSMSLRGRVRRIADSQMGVEAWMNGCMCSGMACSRRKLHLRRRSTSSSRI